MRINKFISLHTEFSRRKADALISENKVKINNQTAKLGDQVSESDQVTISGKAINTKSEKIYLAVNKPIGLITTRKDEQNRATVMELIPNIPNIKPAGRLDINSEGLILFSNDGDFIQKTTNPKNKLEKEYVVTTNQPLSKSDCEKLSSGIEIEPGVTTKPCQIFYNHEQKSQNYYTTKIIICEGKKRQVRKMFAKINNPVKYLKRIRIGTILLGNLKTGQYRPLTSKEINDI